MAQGWGSCTMTKSYSPSNREAFSSLTSRYFIFISSVMGISMP